MTKYRDLLEAQKAALESREAYEVASDERTTASEILDKAMSAHYDSRYTQEYALDASQKAELSYYTAYYAYADEYLRIDNPTPVQDEEYDTASNHYRASFSL